jgi:endonuclease YncB( thermonuclease family)
LAVTVTRVIDGDTFEITPEWAWEGQKGNTVRPKGYDAPEVSQPGYEAAKTKLQELILNKEVDLIKPIAITYGRLLCEVQYEGKDLADYFPEYQ